MLGLLLALALPALHTHVAGGFRLVPPDGAETGSRRPLPEPRELFRDALCVGCFAASQLRSLLESEMLRAEPDGLTPTAGRSPEPVGTPSLVARSRPAPRAPPPPEVQADT